MKNFVVAALASTMTLSFGVAAVADDHSEKKVEVIERNAQGKATMVRMNGKEVAICMNDRQDNCINPRAAGLEWGNRPLGYFPRDKQ